MARQSKSINNKWPICPVRNTDCLAYGKDRSGKWCCGLFIDIDDILAGKEQCKREIEDARRKEREARA